MWECEIGNSVLGNNIYYKKASIHFTNGKQTFLSSTHGSILKLTTY